MKSYKKKNQREMVVGRGRPRGAVTDLFEETEDNSDDDSSLDQSEEQFSMPQRNEGPPPRRGRPPKKARSIAGSNATRSRGSKNDGRASGNKTPTKSLRGILPRTLLEHDGKSGPEEAASQPAVAQSKSGEGFVMKLFDRNLDLSKFAEDTPIYPICRAWFKNQPRKAGLPNYRNRRSPTPVKREMNGVELLNKLVSNEMWEAHSLAPPLKTDLPKIPPPFSPQFNGDTAAIDEAINNEHTWYKRAGPPDLLRLHGGRWKTIRQNWVQHTMQYRHERYKHSYRIIEHLFKKYRPT